MNAKKYLMKLAGWFEDPNNNAMLLVDNEGLDKSVIMAEACLNVAKLLKIASLDLGEDENSSEKFSTLELASVDSEAYNALPESYQADDVLVFYYDVNGNLCGSPKESEILGLGDWEVMFDTDKKEWIQIGSISEASNSNEVIIKESKEKDSKEVKSEKMKDLISFKTKSYKTLESDPIKLSDKKELIVYKEPKSNTYRFFERPDGGDFWNEKLVKECDNEESAVAYLNKRKGSKKTATELVDLKKKLNKYAGLVDDLLISISASSDDVEKKMAELDSYIDNIKLSRENKKYKIAGETSEKDEQLKEIEDSGITKNYKNLEAPLSSRYCPDHAGVMLHRVDENTWQCDLDRKTYNFATGFKLNDGSVVPGGDVSNQTKDYDRNEISLFDTRESRLKSM